MKLIIAGSRRFPHLGLNTWKDWKTNKKAKNDMVDFVYNKVIDNYDVSAITEIVSGCAWGIDTIGKDVAKILGVKVANFPADWDGPLGKGAGFARNIEMSYYADALLVVHSGTNGSNHMIEQMKKLNKPYLEFILNG